MPKRTRAQAGFKRKMRRPKRPRRTYAGSLVPLASRGYRLNATERKVFDIASTGYQVDSAGGLVTLLCIPQLGTDMTERIGRKILIKSIYIKGRVCTRASLEAANILVAPQWAQISIVVDMQPNGLPPAIGDIYTAISSVSHINLNNRDRFKVLKVKQYALGPYQKDLTATMAIGFASQQTYSVKMYKRCNIETIFNATNGGTIADITSGALYMVTQSSSPNGQEANFTLATRVRFSDK